MAINKVNYNGRTLIDLTEDTVTSETLLSGQTAHDRSGQAITGSLSMDPIQSGLAIIVDGDTASMAVPVGGYAYIKNNTHGLTEGLYKNTSSSAFPASGGTADSTVFTAASGEGALNTIQQSFADDVGALSSAMTYVVSGNKSIESVTIPVGAYVRLVGSTITGRSDGIYTVATAIPVDTVIDGTYFNESAPIQGGGLNGIISALYPVGSVYMSFNSALPSCLTAIGTWEAVTGEYVLKTVTSGVGGTLTAAGKTGSTVLTVNQIPSHNHSYTKAYGDGYGYAGGGLPNVRNAESSQSTGYKGGGQGHDHTAGMPANVAVYVWKRTA